MSASYRIERVADFFAVPEDRLDDCLRDFKLYLLAARPMCDLINEVGKEMGHAANVVRLGETFTWMDDGKHDMHVRFHAEVSDV